MQCVLETDATSAADARLDGNASGESATGGKAVADVEIRKAEGDAGASVLLSDGVTVGAVAVKSNDEWEREPAPLTDGECGDIRLAPLREGEGGGGCCEARWRICKSDAVSHTL